MVDFVVASSSAHAPTTLLTQRRGAGGVGVAELDVATGSAATSTPPMATSRMPLVSHRPTARRGVAGVARSLLTTRLRRQTLATPEEWTGGEGVRGQGRRAMWMEAGWKGT